MLKMLLSSALLFSLVQANDPSKGSCELSQEGAFGVNFVAYKTAAKKGVGASFDSVKYTAIAPKGKNFREILVGSSVVIDTKSVNSKNKGRDEKLVKFFFGQMKGETITAKILDYKAIKVDRGQPKKGTLFTEITMNGVTKKVPMNYKLKDGVLTADGVIDIFDFSGNSALASINKACFDLHKGKTWNDVSISFSTKIKAVCYPAK
jgi:hypothetical protein